MRRTAVALLTCLALALAGCADGVPDGVEVAEGWSLEVVRDDLVGPTQLALSADGARVLVAELNGAEDGGQGRVRDLGPGAAGEPTVLVEGLTTPTGIAAPDGTTLLVQEGRDLVRHDLAGGDRTVLVADLPWNGRSQGTLTLVDGGTAVLHTATHMGTEPDLVEGSGAVYRTEVTTDGRATPAVVATGFKVPYAHGVDAAGRLWVTDVGDGRVDGAQVREELHRFDRVDPDVPADGGWPTCTGRNRPVVEMGAGPDACEGLTPPVTTFPPRSTPTGLAMAGDGRVLVALFTSPTAPGRIVDVGIDGTVGDVVRGVTTPQDLLALPDGSVLFTAHLSGQLFRLRPP